MGRMHDPADDREHEVHDPLRQARPREQELAAHLYPDDAGDLPRRHPDAGEADQIGDQEQVREEAADALGDLQELARALPRHGHDGVGDPEALREERREIEPTDDGDPFDLRELPANEAPDRFGDRLEERRLARELRGISAWRDGVRGVREPGVCGASALRPERSLLDGGSSLGWSQLRDEMGRGTTADVRGTGSGSGGVGVGVGLRTVWG